MGKHGYKGFMKANRGSGGGAAKTHSHAATSKTTNKLHYTLHHERHIMLHNLNDTTGNLYILILMLSVLTCRCWRERGSLRSEVQFFAIKLRYSCHLGLNKDQPQLC